MISSLLEVPDLGLMRVLEKCDFVTIQRLRKTCHTVRNFIDDFRPDPLISAVTILVESKEISFQVASSNSGDSVNLIYKNPPEGTLVRRCDRVWGNRITLRNMDIMDVVCQDFELLLRGQKSKIDTFKLDFRYYTGYDFDKDLDVFGEELLEKMRNVLSKKLALKVKNLELMVTKQESIMAILPFLDEKSIESLKFSDAIGTEGRELDLEKILELPHWKSARKISISKFSVSAPIQNFFHFENGSIYLKSISPDDIILMKNNSLNSPTFERFDINLSVKNTENQEFFTEKYGLPWLDRRFREEIAAWFLKKDKETVLKMLINSHSIVFNRIGKEKVPEGVLILE